MARILIADDDARTRDLLRMIFQQHELIVVHDWPELLQALKQHDQKPYALVVTDIVMPGYKDIIKHDMRGIFEKRNVPTIFISGYSEQKMDNLPPQMKFIKKPFSIRMFQSIAKKMLGEE